VAAEGVNAIIADDRGIYYKTGTDGRVYKAKLTGSAGVAIAGSVDAYASFVGQDDTLIYQLHEGGPGLAQAIVK